MLNHRVRTLASPHPLRDPRHSLRAAPARHLVGHDGLTYMKMALPSWNMNVHP